MFRCTLPAVREETDRAECFSLSKFAVAPVGVARHPNRTVMWNRKRSYRYVPCVLQTCFLSGTFENMMPGLEPRRVHGSGGSFSRSVSVACGVDTFVYDACILT